MRPEDSFPWRGTSCSNQGADSSPQPSQNRRRENYLCLRRFAHCSLQWCRPSTLSASAHLGSSRTTPQTHCSWTRRVPKLSVVKGAQYRKRRERQDYSCSRRRFTEGEPAASRRENGRVSQAKELMVDGYTHKGPGCQESLEIVRRTGASGRAWGSGGKVGEGGLRRDVRSIPRTDASQTRVRSMTSKLVARSPSSEVASRLPAASSTSRKNHYRRLVPTSIGNKPLWEQQ